MGLATLAKSAVMHHVLVFAVALVSLERVEPGLRLRDSQTRMRRWLGYFRPIVQRRTRQLSRRFIREENVRTRRLSRLLRVGRVDDLLGDLWQRSEITIAFVQRTTQHRLSWKY